MRGTPASGKYILMNLVYEYATGIYHTLGSIFFVGSCQICPLEKVRTIWRKFWDISCSRLTIPSSVLTMSNPRIITKNYGLPRDVRFRRCILHPILLIWQSWTGASRGEIWHTTNLRTVTADLPTMGREPINGSTNWAITFKR